MRSLRCALLCVCLLTGGLAPARADQPALDACLGALDDFEIDLMILGRDDDSCAARQGEIGDAEALLSDIRKLREGDCRADRIAGGDLDAAKIEALHKILDEDIAWLRSDIDTMRAEAGKVCGSGASAPTGKAPAAPDSSPRQGGNKAASDPGSFALTICNKDSEPADIAVSHPVAPGSVDFWVEGWWSVEPGECAPIGRFTTGWFYYYAESDVGEWSGETPICVSDEPFKRVNHADGDYTCDENLLLPFVELKVDGPAFTINLNP